MVEISKELQEFIDRTGSFRFDYDLQKINWFQVGGQADLMFRPKDEEELQEFLRLRGNIAVFVMGVGSNVIIRDGGFRGCVIRLGRGFTDMKKLSDDKIEVGAGNLDLNVANFSKQCGIAGLEFLSGIPGTIGGALKMNAGAYGSEIKDVLVKAIGYDLEGNKYEIDCVDMGFSYRKSNPGHEIIFTSAILKGSAGDSQEIGKLIADIQRRREDSQPIRSKTGGSTFKNPEGHRAWQLIDEAGCRGLKIGDAQISDMHCNFMINTANAKASDLEELIDTVKEKVKQKSGIELEAEIKIIGQKL